MPRAQSSIAATSEPDCDTSASSPAATSPGAMLAFSPMCGDSMPRLPGPSTRSRCGRAASSIAWRRAGSKPVPMTMAARVPQRPSSASSPGTPGAGVHSRQSAGAGSSVGLACTVWPSGGGAAG